MSISDCNDDLVQKSHLCMADSSRSRDGHRISTFSKMCEKINEEFEISVHQRKTVKHFHISYSIEHNMIKNCQNAEVVCEKLSTSLLCMNEFKG